MSFTHASLFSGIGGFDLAAEWVGWKNVFHCEINEFCAQILKYHFPNADHYEDIKTTDFTKWRGKINVLSGGFPCQSFSLAGRRKGAEDDRYLWPQMLRAIQEIKPDWVVGENVAGIITMVQPGKAVELGRSATLFGEDYKDEEIQQQYVIETVCQDLEHSGYSIQPILIPACAVGAPHRRDRVWFIANRTDTGVKGMQRKWEDNILSGRTASDTTCRGSGGTPHESCCENERQNGYETQQPFVRGCVRASSHSDSDRQWERTCEQEPINERFGTTNYCYGCENGDPAYSKSTRSEGKCGYGQRKVQFNGRNSKYIQTCWEKFPTQPPVCRGNDGLPFDVDDLAISFPKWRAESIKAYGNAIVPQVAYEIFKAIETINKNIIKEENNESKN